MSSSCHVDCSVSQPHYLDHVAPIWRALGDRAGRLFLPEHLLQYAWTRYGFEGEADYYRQDTDWLLVAGFDDQKVVHHPSIIFLEHGAGQTYGNNHSAYTGGQEREHWRLLLAPSERVAQQHPNGQAVGCPKLDRWINRPRIANHEPVVCVSWHWDGQLVAPEAGTAFYEFHDTVLPALIDWCQDQGATLVGHAHPRIAADVWPVYEVFGIPILEDFDQVLRLADVYVCDNSSTIFEFAAVGRPVVLMDASAYRRDVEHGLRFWSHAGIGPHVTEPGDVGAALRLAIEDPREQQLERERLTRDVYVNLGDATRASIRAIESVLDCD